jgi:glutamyl-tRNA synthetase
MSTKGDRVRFAPSPTGYLHIGGVRTALYNWLWARRTGGTFILRIEDTDRERSTDESVRVILDSMRWCGLDWDEGPEVGGPNGPYFQTQRLEMYREFAEKLIARGHAFRCYCTKEELDAQRAKLPPGAFFRYPGTCRNRTGPPPDRPWVVRLKAPSSGITGWLDLVKGRIDVPNDQQQDVVLVRSDGVPLYNFGAVVDDITMGITLVARGDDHVVNTPIQILIYEGLGYPVPKFAHLPMILGPDGKKLSKRHAAVSVREYREMGYLPDAVLNYLARLGWSHGDQEIFTREELIEKFDWAHVGRTPAMYDAKKFAYVQASHLRRLRDDELAERARPFLPPQIAEASAAEPVRYVAAVGTVKTRATTLIEVCEMIEYYFREPPAEDENAVAKYLVKEAALPLRGLRDVVAKVARFERAAIEAAVSEWLAARGLQLKHVAQPARVALTGRAQSPGLFEVMEVLGRERTLARLDRGIARCVGREPG